METQTPAVPAVVPPPSAGAPPAPVVVEPAAPAPSPAAALAAVVPAAPAPVVAADPVKQPVEPAKEEKPKTPAVLELKLPPGATFDPALLEGFKTLAKEKGFSSEQAQALVDWQAKQIAATQTPEAKAAQAKAEEAAWVDFAAKQRTADLDALKADKVFGGANTDKTVNDARSALKQFFGEEVSKELTARAMDNNPHFIRGLATIRRLLSEDTTTGRIHTPAPEAPAPRPLTLGQQMAATFPKRKQ